MRIGHGHDTHRLQAGTYLRLGGITLEAPVSAVGHSDADCLVHAICDALLGALTLGDIGRHFPDTDNAYRGIDSTQLLKHVVDKMKTRGYQLVHLDTIIHLERPKLAPHLDAMRAVLANHLQTHIDRINIKATTGEGLGIVGRGEAIVCDAVILIAKEVML
ncbi:MAG: 2-C-methyl-D-erythritol 2,4-cyclodiphosphate synthase [Acholeplasmatales bacterium]|nr:MAG: 2-C-methyl-D-erythritol 2,4-cyclodiphosphate synthase [Acholeplasmatales bacterium]